MTALNVPAPTEHVTDYKKNVYFLWETEADIPSIS
jgi:hypothetical protein